MSLKPKHKMNMGLTEAEALILANQALIMQSLEMLIDKPKISEFLNKAVVNVHDVLSRHVEKK